MNHPFDLELRELETLDLEFEEPLSLDEASQVNGSLRLISRSESKVNFKRRPRLRPPRPIYPRPIYPVDPPSATTLALGEEGGWHPPQYTTLALGEEGGGYPLD